MDVVSIGNPLLDLTVEVEDGFLESLNLEKGTMHLVSEEQARVLLGKILDLKKAISPGGSGANTSAAVAVFGGEAAFIGSIGLDEQGTAYKQLTEQDGVFPILKNNEEETGFAITFITSDGQRTFTTFLGAALKLTEEDISEEDIKQAAILHIEGFQLEPTNQRNAAIKAMKIARANNTKVAIDLADARMIERLSGVLGGIIEEYANIVFVNEEEAEAFTGRKAEEAAKHIKKICDIAIVKLGEQGSIIINDEGTHTVPVTKANVENTNGAGDMYAGAFLYGLAKGFTISEAGMLASFASAKVVECSSARLDKDKREEVQSFLQVITNGIQD